MYLSCVRYNLSEPCCSSANEYVPRLIVSMFHCFARKALFSPFSNRPHIKNTAFCDTCLHGWWMHLPNHSIVTFIELYRRALKGYIDATKQLRGILLGMNLNLLRAASFILLFIVVFPTTGYVVLMPLFKTSPLHCDLLETLQLYPPQIATGSAAPRRSRVQTNRRSVSRTMRGDRDPMIDGFLEIETLSETALDHISISPLFNSPGKQVFSHLPTSMPA